MKHLLMPLSLALAAAIAIPTIANAQTTTAVPQTKECCKEKKDCDKNKKDCAKEGKACCKEGKAPKKGMRKIGQLSKDNKRPAGDRKEMGKRRGGENPLMKGITLTDDQQAKMKALRKKNASDMKQKKAEAKAKSRDEMQKLRADFDKEVAKILDKDQLKQYQANKAEMEANRAAKTKKK